jgi:hypothetical protein
MVREISSRRMRRAAAAATFAAAAALVAVAAVPASAHAADLFPIDDWIGEGLKSAGDVVLGPLKIGATEIARLLATTVGALADLLIPKSLVNAGLDGIRWLVAVPTLGTDPSGGPGSDVTMPHVTELRQVLTWVGITLLPFGLTVAGGRAIIAPGLDNESPSEVLQRVLVAGLGLVLYDWAWGVMTHLVGLITDAVLGLPWVADGVRRMLQALLIGGATGTAVASEFVVPLLLTAAGGTLLALLLVRVGLEVAGALLYVTGGLALGISATNFGRRILMAWLIAATAMVILPVLWSVVFATGAALMLDSGTTTGHGSFGDFVAQLYNVAAALAVFAIAIKIALSVFRHATSAITTVAATPGAGSTSRGSRAASGPTRQRLAQNASPAGLSRFAQSIRGGVRTGGTAAAKAIGQPLAGAGIGGLAIRATQQASGRLRTVLRGRRGVASGLKTAGPGGSTTSSRPRQPGAGSARARSRNRAASAPTTAAKRSSRRTKKRALPTAGRTRPATPPPRAPGATRPARWWRSGPSTKPRGKDGG